MITAGSNNGAKCILVVDDEPSIVGAIAASLRCSGLHVDEATCGQAALESAKARPPHLTVLDTTLPDFDSLELARRLRAFGIEGPVLFLAAHGSIRAGVAGLSVGPNDYLTKPFALADLVTRVHALLLRAGVERQEDQRLRFADVEMDEGTRQVRRAGAPIRLNAMEYNLLRFFLLNPHRVLSKMEIVDHVWRYDFRGDTSIVESYVGYLRKKLNPHGPQLIHTILRVGYILRDACA